MEEPHKGVQKRRHHLLIQVGSWADTVEIPHVVGVLVRLELVVGEHVAPGRQPPGYLALEPAEVRHREDIVDCQGEIAADEGLQALQDGGDPDDIPFVLLVTALGVFEVGTHVGRSQGVSDTAGEALARYGDHAASGAGFPAQVASDEHFGCLEHPCVVVGPDHEVVVV